MGTCEVEVTASGHLHVDDFDLGAECDQELVVNDDIYTAFDGPDDVYVMSGDKIRFESNLDCSGGGKFDIWMSYMPECAYPPSPAPTSSPTQLPSPKPSMEPTISFMPSSHPTEKPTFEPSFDPTQNPSARPTIKTTLLRRCLAHSKQT